MGCGWLPGEGQGYRTDEARMKLRALVRDREGIERFLRHQNLWTEPLGLAEARPPPHFRGITRLKATRQAELFE